MSIFSKKMYDMSMRNIQKEVLVLSVKPQGESNRIVTFFTEDEGICTAILYGGPKSKLRSRVSMWNYGQIYLYNDESKHTSKITDFDVKNYHLSFRESLFKTWAANLAVEITMRTKCAGCPKESFFLLNGFLDGLDILDERQGETGLIRFLWRYLGLLGIQPEIYSCIKCNESFFTGNLGENNVSYKLGGAIYSQTENGFICSDCFKASFDKMENSFFTEISSKAAAYLEATSVCEHSVSRKMTLSETEIKQLKSFVFFMIETGIGTKIKTLQTGIGIL